MNRQYSIPQTVFRRTDEYYSNICQLLNASVVGDEVVRMTRQQLQRRTSHNNDAQRCLTRETYLQSSRQATRALKVDIGEKTYLLALKHDTTLQYLKPPQQVKDCRSLDQAQRKPAGNRFFQITIKAACLVACKVGMLFQVPERYNAHNLNATAKHAYVQTSVNDVWPHRCSNDPQERAIRNAILLCSKYSGNLMMRSVRFGTISSQMQSQCSRN